MIKKLIISILLVLVVCVVYLFLNNRNLNQEIYIKNLCLSELSSENNALQSQFSACLANVGVLLGDSTELCDTEGNKFPFYDLFAKKIQMYFFAGFLSNTVTSVVNWLLESCCNRNLISISAGLFFLQIVRLVLSACR